MTDVADGLAASVPRPRPSTRLPRLPTAAPSLVGLAVIAALLPARGLWVAGVVLLALTFTVPGVLLLRTFRVPAAAVSGYPLYIPAASLAVLFAAGLGMDLIGPHVGIAHPLRGVTLALTTVGVSLVLWLMGLGAPAAARVPWRRCLDSPAALVPLLLPLISAAGAQLLSHGEGALIARIGQLLVAVALLIAFLLARRLHPGHTALLLFAIALAAEWAFSLRSQEVVGFDITTEIGIAQHVHAAGIWHTQHPGDAYGAMLSVTILPSALASLTGTSPLIAFKVVYPILTALLPVSVFLLGVRFLRPRFAVAAAGLLAVQTYFFQQLPQLARQEIALLIFAVLVVALLDDRLTMRPRLRLVAAMSAALVLSHYSSTYLAIPIILVSLAAALAAPRLRRATLLLPLACCATVLIGGAALWYAGITHSSNNVTSFRIALARNGLDLLPNNHGNILSRYLNGTQAQVVTPQAYAQVAARAYASRQSYIHPLPQSTQRRYTLAPTVVQVPPRRLKAVAQVLQFFVTLFGELMLVFAVIGAVWLTFRRRRVSSLGNHLGVLAISTVGILALIRISATVASSYNQTRALAQSLLLLSLPAAWLGQMLFDRTRSARGARRTSSGIAGLLALTFPLMFACQSSLSAVLTGGGTLLNISQRGEDFQRQYMTAAELAGASWAAEMSQRRLLYADPYGQLRLNATSGAVALNQVTPRTLDRHAWLYGSHTNTVLGTARGEANSVTAVYAWPKSYLDAYYDTVFSDGDSKVYHR